MKKNSQKLDRLKCWKDDKLFEDTMIDTPIATYTQTRA